MVTRWLHLVMLGGDDWIVPIWAAAISAAEAKRVGPLTAELRELGLHISVRLDILRRVAQRLNQETRELHEAAKRHEPKHVFTVTAPGKAFRINDDLKYPIIADIDALLFEIDSCWQLMRKLFELLRAHVGAPIVGGKTETTNELRRALGDGTNPWFRWLDRQRNFVAHEGTPYLAIDVTDDQRWELLVMKENLKTFVDQDKFFRYTELIEVAGGFNGVRQGLQTHLIQLLKSG